VGWEAVGSGMQLRDRSAGNDRRLAGVSIPNSGTDLVKYRIDLPAVGRYSITWASGDAAYAAPTDVDLYDTTTRLGALSSGNTSATQKFKDGTNTEYSNSTWPVSKAAIAMTFASTILRIQSLGTSLSVFTHISVAAIHSYGFQKNVLRPHMFRPGLAR
jgi:hypothetical protein